MSPLTATLAAAQPMPPQPGSGAAVRGAGAGQRPGGPFVPSRGAAPRQTMPGDGSNLPYSTIVPREFAGTGLAAAIAQAKRMSGIEPRSYTFEETGEEIEYAVFVPRRVDEDEPSPLVVALHGMGGHPAIVVGQIRDEANRHGYIVVAPMGYNPWGGYGAYPLGLGNPPDPQINEWSEQDVMNVLALAREEFNIDDRRIYILGQSMGGAGALHLGRKYGEIWAAVGATAPAVDDSEPAGLEAVRDLPFVIVHGDADPAVPVERSRGWALKLNELGMSFKYFEIPGGGHSDAILRGAPYVFDFFDAHIRAD